MTTFRNLSALTALLLLAISVNGHPYDAMNKRSTSNMVFPSDNNEYNNNFASKQLQQSYNQSKSSTGDVNSSTNDSVEKPPPILPFATKSINKMKNKKKPEVELRFAGTFYTKETVRNIIGNMFKPNPYPDNNGYPNSPNYPAAQTPTHHKNNGYPSPPNYAGAQPPTYHTHNTGPTNNPVHNVPSHTPSDCYQPGQKQEASGNSVANNQNSGSSQSIGTNTYSLNEQNPCGTQTKNVASGISSNIEGDRVNLAGTHASQQSYHNDQGSGQQANSQAQSVNRDGKFFGMNSVNAGAKQISGPNGQQISAESTVNSHQQAEHGTSDTNAHTSVISENQNGVHHSSANSVVISSMNNGGNSNSASTSTTSTSSTSTNSASNYGNGHQPHTGGSSNAGANTVAQANTHNNNNGNGYSPHTFGSTNAGANAVAQTNTHNNNNGNGYSPHTFGSTNAGANAVAQADRGMQLIFTNK